MSNFAASLSGLTAASTAIDIVGNNISNLQTVGFKTSKARFADVLAAAVPGGPPASVASAGVTTTIIRQNDQGTIVESDNPLNMGISGLGFFRLDSNGEITYTRDGRFQLGFDSTNPDKRFLENTQGRGVTGYLADYTTDPKGLIVTTAAPQEISFNATMPAKPSSSVFVAANLNASTVPPTITTFDPADSRTYNDTTGTTTYDATGAAHDLRLYLVRAPSGNLWDIYSTMDNGTPTGPVNLSFDANGLMTGAMPLAAQTYGLGNGGSLSIALDFTGSTMYGNPFSVESITQDGWREGVIDNTTKFRVGSDGVIQADYSNGRSRNVGQVVLANFVNPDAMIGIGDSQWKANADPVSGTGKEILDVPGRGLNGQGLGSVQGGAKEESNVDLNTELVALIEQQRNYQASAQTFKILDQVLQNLTNLGK